MITRIKVRNFLSLENVDLDLRARNVFVGANMSGKSNLIECFRFLQESLSPSTQAGFSALHLAFHKRGELEEVVWKGHPDGPIEFEIEAEFPDLPSSRDNRQQYRYFFSLGPSEFGHPKVREERLLVHRKGKWETILENAGNELMVEIGGKSIRQGSNHPMDLAVGTMGRQKSSSCYAFHEFARDWRFYSLAPVLMRQPNGPAQEEHLSEHGENLSAWLLTLQTYPEFQTLKQVARDVLPELAEIQFHPSKDWKLPPVGATVDTTVEPPTISVGTSETMFDRPTSIARMSDGELAFLALTSLILAPAKLSPALMCIEEPENYLHPRLLEILVELLNQRQLKARAPQVIATTHSPLLVDKLTLDDLVVTEKIKGATRFTRASSKKHLKKLLASKEVLLGDLLFSGALSEC